MKRWIFCIVTFLLFSSPCLSYDLDSDLVGAVIENDLNKAEQLIAKGASPNTKNLMGRTTLHLAAAKGNTKMAELLISKGAELNVPDRYGLTPLHLGATAGEEIIILLVNKGADVNARDRFGATPLHAAAKSGNENAVLQLIALNADPFARDQEGGTPSDWAELYGQSPIVTVLKRQTQEDQYGNCHHYIYHQITGQYSQRRVEYDDIMKTLTQYHYKLARTYEMFSQVKSEDLQTGDVILIGTAHSAIIRQVGKELKAFHFRGITDWDKGKVKKRSDWTGLDYGVYVHDVEILAKMKTKKESYGDLKAHIYKLQISGQTLIAPIYRIDSKWNEAKLDFDDTEVKIGKAVFSFNKEEVWGRLDVKDQEDGTATTKGEFTGKINAKHLDTTPFPQKLEAIGHFDYDYRREPILEDGEVIYKEITLKANGTLEFYAYKNKNVYTCRIQLEGDYDDEYLRGQGYQKSFIFEVSLP
ncbi:MAG: ankyrin repeat domain-containing protein [Planctomycetota bacterium]